jgi:hypothetical protein
MYGFSHGRTLFINFIENLIAAVLYQGMALAVPQMQQYEYRALAPAVCFFRAFHIQRSIIFSDRQGDFLEWSDFWFNGS